jgi:Pyruvate/2-oxoacid:ferredoxin oxidoreductase delta subunit
MPAIQDEIDEAEEEGISFKYLLQPVKINLTQKRRIAVTFQRMKLGSPDQSHRPKAVPVRGNFLTLETDSLISAVGELVDLSWIPKKLIKDDLIDTRSTPKIFAGGDAVPQPRTIVTAIASGKKAAISIDWSLRRGDDEGDFSKISVGTKGSLSMEDYLQGRDNGKWPEKKEVVSYQQINTLYFEPSRRVRMRRRHRDKVLKGFSEVHLGYNTKEANLSASRCFSCGTCNYCYNCYFFCPEGVISLNPVDRTRVVDYLHCKGCGTCAKACPRSVVVMKELL